MPQTINHTLWVVNVSARPFHASITGAIAELNEQFLSNCLGDVEGGQFTCGSAIAVERSPITPTPYDAVVFLVNNVNVSVTAKLGANMQAIPGNALGDTLLGAPGGGCAEVFWDRCFGDAEAARAIFHEAAHLKSGMANAMHVAVVGAPHGGPGLRVLSAPGGSFKFPSYDDLEFYQRAIPRRIQNRTQAP
jgi:hypothetical protein